jgi:hypothetical protein
VLDPEICSSYKPTIAAWKSCGAALGNLNHPSAREKQMAHNHGNEGNEYQIRIVHGDGTEELERMDK